MYAAWFASAYGSLNLTNSNGLFLWTRTMSFANCAVIKPPADLQALCPNRQPGYLNQPVASRPLPKRYLWDHQAWQWQPPSTGLVPDTAAFTKAKNDRAMSFAIHAIAAQPLAYLHVVAKDALHPFVGDSTLDFPAAPDIRVRAQPGQPRLRPGRGARLYRQRRGDRPVPRPPLRLPAAAAVRPPDERLPARGPVPRPPVRPDPHRRAGRDPHPPPAQRGRRAAVVLSRGLDRAADRRARIHLPLRRPGHPAGLHGARARVPRPRPR